MGRVLVQLPGSNTTKLLSETLPKNVMVVDEQLHQLRVHDGTTPGGHVIGDTAGSGVPIGTIIPFAGNSIPQGYLLCDGSAISRTNYASLFAVIGTIYGAGDGNTTFKLPNLLDKTIRGDWDGNHTGFSSTGELPNIIGNFDCKVSGASANGAFATNSTWSTQGWNGAAPSASYNFTASRYNSAYSRSDSIVIANSLTMKWCIKF